MKSTTKAIYKIAIMIMCNVSIMTANCMDKVNNKDEKECQRLAEFLDNYFALSLKQLETTDIRMCANPETLNAQKKAIEEMKTKGEEYKKMIAFYMAPEEINNKYMQVLTRGDGLCFLYSLGEKNYEFYEKLKKHGIINNIRLELRQYCASLAKDIFVPNPDLVLDFDQKRVELNKLANDLAKNRGKTKEAILGWLKILADSEEGKNNNLVTQLCKEVSCIVEQLEEYNELFNRIDKLETKISTPFYGEKVDYIDELLKLRDAINAKVAKKIACVVYKVIDDANAITNIFLFDDKAYDTSCKVSAALTSIQKFLSYLTDNEFWSLTDCMEYYSIIPAYMDFSKRYGKLALYCGYFDCDSGLPNPLPHKKWAIFDGDKTSFAKGGDSVKPDGSSYYLNAGDLNSLELNGIDAEDFSDEGIKHLVILETSHASRAIPRKYYERIKTILEGKGTYVYYDAPEKDVAPAAPKE